MKTSPGFLRPLHRTSLSVIWKGTQPTAHSCCLRVRHTVVVDGRGFCGLLYTPSPDAFQVRGAGGLLVQDSLDLWRRVQAQLGGALPPGDALHRLLRYSRSACFISSTVLLED